jgi:inner membrane protein
MENQSEKPMTTKSNFFQSNTAKMIMVGALTLFLLIPLALVQDLISERSQRKTEVIAEVTNSWGEDINFYGPILKVPYKEETETTYIDSKTKQTSVQKTTSINYAYFFPEVLQNKTKVEKVSDIKRSLYNPIVFKADMAFNGSFENLNFDKLGIKKENIVWDKVSVIIKTTNLKSIKR